MNRLLPLILLAAASLTAHAEFRGAWVSSVYNINFPTDEGLSTEVQKAQAIRIIEAAKAAGMNAHLSKPIDPEIMYATLSRLISGD